MTAGMGLSPFAAGWSAAQDRVAPSDVLAATDISKRYGQVHALKPVCVSVSTGELLAVTGHNGAGKSTLIKILSGQTRSDTGRVTIRGLDVPASYSPSSAHRLGVRVVDQEVTLCRNLTVMENFLIAHRCLGGVRWRGRIERMCQASLEVVFPDSRVSPRAEVNNLPMAQRQMASIAFAAYVAPAETPLSLLILDEPTSSLDIGRRDQLFEYLATLRSTGASVLLISHRLDEVLAHSDRIVVLRDGAVVGTLPTHQATRGSLIDLMGQAEASPPAGDQRESLRSTADLHPEVQTACAEKDATPLVELTNYSGAGLHQVSMSVRSGEVVGLGGLEGNGQRALLNTLYSASRRRRARHHMRVTSHIAYLSGDRSAQGVFHLWSVEKNLSIASLGVLLRWGLVRRRSEARLADRWIRDLAIRVPHRESVITSLSGGSQQKVLIARVLASGAKLILLDDPTRGVDVGTKRDIHALLHAATLEGRSFLWYSTENEELRECDRVLVMREGRIVGEFAGDRLGDRELIDASFSDVDALGAAVDSC